MSKNLQALKDEQNNTKGQVLVLTAKNEKAAENAPKAEEKPQETKVKTIVMPTAEQRLKNLDNFQMLGKRFKFLQTKQDELNTFSISNDETQEKLKLTNASGFSFELSNSNVIAEVVDVINLHLQKKLEATEQEILNFAI